ncbi:unnamed protein product [Pseudo-nitzschia multistriata]|uniref:Large ribosomal subunit protein bL21m n=1 Tax=Pseudo-nitzschia multistriata TaxID=183589 RepID=A0A448ZMK6_9STRA|nr:unnamed protein product [Pseudo-nitzschia multistriata]
MNSAVSIAGRRWRSSRAGMGLVRQRLAMGLASPPSLDRCGAFGFKAFSSGDSEPTAPKTPSSFAVVDHSRAYEASMEGRHGQQLALARLEGIGKDDLPFDPFEEEERKFLEEEEERAKLLEAADGEGGDVEEADEFGLEEEDDDEEEEDNDDETTGRYNRDGSVRLKKSVLATLRAGYPAGGLFAVVELAGSQHKVTTDDLLVVNKLKPIENYPIGSVHTLTDVLLVGSSHRTLVGMPRVAGAEVDVMVEEITQDAKVVIFKKRRRKHSQRKNGFRRDLMLLRVLDVRLPEEHRDHAHVGRDESLEDLDTVNQRIGGDDEVSRFDNGGRSMASA